ncbi:MAG: hypothetical protein ACLS36_07470 [Streptococcus sp.]
MLSPATSNALDWGEELWLNGHSQTYSGTFSILRLRLISPMELDWKRESRLKYLIYEDILGKSII